MSNFKKLHSHTILRYYLIKKYFFPKSLNFTQKFIESKYVRTYIHDDDPQLDFLNLQRLKNANIYLDKLQNFTKLVKKRYRSLISKHWYGVESKYKRLDGGWGWTDGILRLHIGFHTCLATGTQPGPRYRYVKAVRGGSWRLEVGGQQRWKGGLSSGRLFAAAWGGPPRLGAQEAPVGGY